MQQSRAIGNFTAGVVVDWKIFDSLESYTNVRAAALQRDRITHALIRQRALVRSEVQSAHARFVSALAQQEPLAKALQGAKDTSDMLKRRYLSGAALIIEFLQAEDVRRDIELAIVQNAIDTAQAHAALKAARGDM
jgi:outer membrane protein TolC